MSSSLVYSNKTSGAKMVRLNAKQLDVKLDFIRDYMGSSNAATSSKFDANANVSKKNIATLSAEINKDINIQINRHMLVNKITEMFGTDLAEEYVRQLDAHEIYSHDETNLAPYTYGASEAIVAYKNGEKLLTTFEQLYDMYSELEEELLDEEKGVWAKHPKDLFIDDINGKTQITRLVKKTRHRDMVRVKTKYGEDLIVTDNHPLIVDQSNIENTIEAVESLGKEQFKKDTVFEEQKTYITPLDVDPCYENYGDYCIYGINNNKRIEGVNSKILLNDKLGYAVGFFIAEGSYSKMNNGFSGIEMTQGNKKTLKKVANYIYETTGIAGKIYKDVRESHKNRNSKYVLSYGSSAFLYKLFSEYFQIPAYAVRKGLPTNLYSTNQSFIDGLLSGLIDGDGSICSGKSLISIRLASRALISQLGILLRSFDFGVAMSYQEQREQAFGISFGLTGKLSFEMSEKVNTFRDKITKNTHYKTDKSEIISVTKIVNNAYLDNFIYDITTDSHHFLCNNIQVHNCVSITMYPFLRNGLRDLGGESDFPRHVDSFAGSFVNLVFAVSSQFSGAVATGEWLMCLDYYCRKDYGSDYIKTHTKKIENHLQHMVYALNQPAAARGYQSAFWNISIFDKHYFESLFEGFVFPVNNKEDEKLYKKDPSIFKPCWNTLEKLQEFFMTWFNKERTRSLLTFPVVTAAMLTDEKTKRPRDKRFSGMLAQEMSEGNSFFIYTSDKADSLSSCCRLRNELSDNTFSFTLGAGGIATGSINVITMNISRLVQNALKECVAPNEQVMHKILKEQVEKIHKYQVAYRRIMEEFKEKGLLTIYDAGFIDLNKQFLTLGVNGLVEAAEAWGLKPGNNDEYIDWTGRLLKIIFDTNKEGKAAYKVKFNTEMVPAENLGVKNSKWDKQAGYFAPRECYNSYFYPVEDTEINALDKFVLHGERIVKWLDGGSALHLNIEQYMSKAQYLKLFEVAGKCGTNYWTTNCLVTICNECNNIDKNKQMACPKCGGIELDYATRVIGYLKKISSFSLDRQKEEAKRFYHPSSLKTKAK